MTENRGLSPESVEHRGVVLSGALLLGSLLFRSADVTLGVLVGASLSLLNFRWLRRFATTLLSSGKRRPSVAALIFHSTKYLISGLAIFLAIKYHLANVFALLGGVSVIFLAVCWEGFARQSKPREDTSHAIKF